MTHHMPKLNRVAKWRSVLTAWQLGTRLKGDPESDAVRDHREATIVHRVEITAIVDLLIKKWIITQQQFIAAVEREAESFSRELEKKFPGMRATDIGIEYYDIHKVRKTMEGWKP